MFIYPEIDPVALHIGPLAIRWYGLMYVIGFLGGYWLLRWRLSKQKTNWSIQELGDLIFYAACGVILGARIGYTLFYNFSEFLQDPAVLLRIWEGGMSFHGGALGVLLAIIWFTKKTGHGFFECADFIVPVVPIGLGAGRIGNFINGELWGRVTDVPWAVIPSIGALPRHPSQLYEAFLEGLVLFTVLWIFSAKPKPKMAVSGLFLVLYGVFRFTVEFVREPDRQLGTLAWEWLTMGQLLTVPMLIVGVILLICAYSRNHHAHL